MGKGYQHVGERERHLIQNMQKEGIPWTKIEKITQRSRDTLNKILHPPKGVKKDVQKGQPRKLPPKEFEKVLKAMAKLQKKNHPHGKEVTASMILSDAGVNVSERTLSRELRAKGFFFYKLKERQTLTSDDVKERKVWSKAHKGRTKAAWVRRPHAIIDNKHWQLFTTGAGRSHAARRLIRGAYQKRGEQPEGHMVKPKGGNMKYPARGVTVTAAVIKGRIRMWNYVDGNWNGQKAADMYNGPLLRAMKRAYPGRAKKSGAAWEVLEDNDPAGFKSSKARTAKLDAGIKTDDLPRRSPDLNVLDYSLWRAINIAMRAQERTWPQGKTETAEEFKARLRKTAMGLPVALVKKVVGNMHARCRLCLSAKPPGGLFKEGGV